MNQIQHEQYTGKGGIYQQLTLPISENILMDEHEPVYEANAQLGELDYGKLYQVYSSKGRKSAEELRSKCFKSSDETKIKEIRMCVESAEHRKTAFENLLSERGALPRMNRSVQVEGAFGVLKSDRNFRRFLTRGRTNISTELFLLCLAFDLQKFFSKLQRGKRKSHLFPLKKE